MRLNVLTDTNSGSKYFTEPRRGKSSFQSFHAGTPADEAGGLRQGSGIELSKAGSGAIAGFSYAGWRRRSAFFCNSARPLAVRSKAGPVVSTVPDWRSTIR